MLMGGLDCEGRREISWRRDPRRKSILVSSELGRSIMDFVLLKVGRKTGGKFSPLLKETRKKGVVGSHRVPQSSRHRYHFATVTRVFGHAWFWARLPLSHLTQATRCLPGQESQLGSPEPARKNLSTWKSRLASYTSKHSAHSP